jgi:hypothetical protein
MIKRLLSLAILLTISFITIHAKEPEGNKAENQRPKVVINHKMIERFNQADFDENALTFQDVLRTYSMEDVKLLTHTYRNTEFVYTDKETMDEKLAEMKSGMEEQEVRSANGNMATLK